MVKETKYIPGVCNINPAEIRRRKNIGFMGLGTLVVLGALLFSIKALPIVWLVVFVPSFIMATGFLQAKYRFCVGYASAGMQHAGESAAKIENQDAMVQDQRRARQINMQAALIAAILTVVAIGVAFIV